MSVTPLLPRFQHKPSLKANINAPAPPPGASLHFSGKAEKTTAPPTTVYVTGPEKLRDEFTKTLLLLNVLKDSLSQKDAASKIIPLTGFKEEGFGYVSDESATHRTWDIIGTQGDPYRFISVDHEDINTPQERLWIMFEQRDGSRVAITLKKAEEQNKKPSPVLDKLAQLGGWVPASLDQIKVTRYPEPRKADEPLPENPKPTQVFHSDGLQTFGYQTEADKTLLSQFRESTSKTVETLTQLTPEVKTLKWYELQNQLLQADLERTLGSLRFADPRAYTFAGPIPGFDPGALRDALSNKDWTNPGAWVVPPKDDGKKDE